MTVRVLIVDDEESIRVALTEFIKGDNYVIHTAEDAAEALSLMDEYAFDVIVSDIILPRVNGVALLKMIHERSPDTQVIMLTGDPTVETAAGAVRAGAFDYLTKPISSKALRRVVASAARIKTLTDKKKLLEEENRRYREHLEELVEERTTALRKSERKYRATFESTGTATVIIEEDTTLSMVNAQFEKLCGYLKEEIEGKKSWTEFVVTEDLERMKEHHCLRRTDGDSAPANYEFRFIDRHGEAKDILLSIAMIPGTKRSVASLLDITGRKHSEESVKRLLAQQVMINQLSLKLGETTKLNEVYRLIYEQVRGLMGAQAFIVSSFDGETNLIRAGYVLHKGQELDAGSFPPISLEEKGHGTQSQVIRTGKPLYFPDYDIARIRTEPATAYDVMISDGATQAVRAPRGEERSSPNKSVLYVPMKIEGEVTGVMQLQSTQHDAYTQDDIDLLAGLANVAAVAVRNAQLIDEIEADAEDLQATLSGIIEALAATTETRDPYTSGHQQRVTRLAIAIAEDMGIPDEQRDGIRVASLLHDIGKMSVPAEILSKPTRLTETEFALIKNHSIVAYNILKVIDFPWPVADIVLQHHERLNGSGYPNGLKGDEIMLEPRILAVADVVEAMSSHRPYRPALGIDDALEEIKSQRGIRYDSVVVDACLSLFDAGFSFSDGDAS